MGACQITSKNEGVGFSQGSNITSSGKTTPLLPTTNATATLPAATRKVATVRQSRDAPNVKDFGTDSSLDDAGVNLISNRSAKS